jgi:hypothetical protein
MNVPKITRILNADLIFEYILLTNAKIITEIFQTLRLMIFINF